jgi:hypothetical protein
MLKNIINSILNKAIERVADFTIDIIQNYLESLTCGFEE